VSDPILFVVDDDAVTLASLAGTLDVRDHSVKRPASAAGERVIAIDSIHEYLRDR
jgi:ActR/RegA family two-component response regulator